MKSSKSWTRRAVLACVASLMAGGAVHAQSGDAGVDAIIAERFAMIADETLLLPKLNPPLLRQSAALLDVARLLKPDEVRFARASADVLLMLGDRDRALDALAAVRKLEPSDQVTMIQFIDLTASKMETAEAKVAYLRQIVDARGVAPEVKSHAAFQLMDLYYMRSQDAEGDEMMQTALKLNPQNIAALRMKYQIAASTGDDNQRIASLCELIRAVPNDATLLTQLAKEGDAVGDYENSGFLRMIALAINMSNRASSNPEDAIDFVASQMLAGNDQMVGQTVEQLLQSLKEDGRMYSLALLLEQMQGKTAEEQKEFVQIARGVYLAQLAGVSQLLNDPDKTEMPTTMPAVPMPNIKADIAKLKQADPRQLSAAYAVALVEQLWFDLYFKAAEVDDTHIAALASLLGENDPIVVRFQGWKLLSAGKTDEARLKLEAVQDRDGFARLGLIAADLAKGETDSAREKLTRAIRLRPSGMVAAYAAVAARRLDMEIEQTEEEKAITKAIAPTRAFVSDVLDNTRGLYLLTGQPEQASVGLGEPLVATVTLLNNGRVPITIGPGALVEPLFMIDVYVKGLRTQPFPGASYGKWTGAVRLLPQQKISQKVRLDRGQLYYYLQQYASPLFPMTANVTTNPRAEETGYRPGAGGQQARLGQAMERRSSPLYSPEFRASSLAKLSGENARDRLVMAELFARILPALKQQTDNADATAAATEFEAALTKQIESEPNAESKVWMQIAYISGDNAFEQSMKFAEGSSVVGQMASMLGGRMMAKEQRVALAQAVLRNNPTPAVAEFAQALLIQPDVELPKPPAEGEAEGETNQ